MLCGHTLARLADGPEWCSNPHSECPQGLRVCIRCMCAVVNPSCTVPIRPLCRRPILAVHFQAHEACVWATQAHDACVWATQGHEACVWATQGHEACVWDTQAREAVSGLHKRTRLCLGYTSARGLSLGYTSCLSYPANPTSLTAC